MAGETTARPLPIKLLRGIAWVLIGAVGLVAALLLAFQLLLRTDFADRKIAEIADAQLKNLLAGKLTLGRVSVRGALNFCVTNVALDDPDGVPAVRVKELCVSADVIALARKQVRVQSLALTSPEVFLTREIGTDGKPTTSLVRAVALRHPVLPAVVPPSPFAWSFSVDTLAITDGAFEIRESPTAAPTLSVHGLQLGGSQARYARSGAAAKLALQGSLKLHGEEKVQVSLDAGLDGAVTQGKIALRSLEAHLGSSGFEAKGVVDLAQLSGNLHLTNVVLEPADLDQLLGTLPLAAELKGEAEVVSDGKEAHAAVHLETPRGGRIGLLAQSTLANHPRWSIKLDTDHVDPAFVVRGAPEGSVTMGLQLQGTGLPKFDEHGVEGDVNGTLHVGPAQLKETGALTADTDFSLAGRSVLVKKLDAEALAVHVRAHGQFNVDELGLDLQLDASDLQRFARSLGALRKKPPIALAGAAHLRAHVTGTLKKPDAQLHLRAPKLSFGQSLLAQDLAIDGSLSGKINEPHGTLNISAAEMSLAGIGLGSPKITALVTWPKAHVQLDAQVGAALGDKKQETGTVHIAGDAQIDEDRDGAVLTGFVIAWPGNELQQEQLTRLHLRPKETVLEPLVLSSPNGNVSIAATVRPAPRSLEKGKPQGPTGIEVDAKLEKFDLSALPKFALPPDLHLAGTLDLNARITGTTAEPDIKATLGLRKIEVQSLTGIDGNLSLTLGRDRLGAQGKITGLLGSTLDLKASIPIEADAAGSTPVELDLTYGPVDLAKLPDLLKRQDLYLAKPAGLVSLHATARGTLDRPRADLLLEAKDVVWSKYHQLGARLEVKAESDRLRLSTTVRVIDTDAATLTAETPLDLTAALRKPSLFATLLDRPSSAKLSVPNLELALLSKAGLLAEGSSGLVKAELELSGTDSAPQLEFKGTVKQLSIGAIHKLDLAARLALAQRLHFDAEGLPGGQARAKVSLDAQISASELLAAARAKFSLASINPMLDRHLALDVDVENVIIGSTTAQGKVRLPLRGELTGHIEGSGTPDAPLVKGKLLLRDIEAGIHQLGDAEVYLEANKDGATAHLGLSPPSGEELARRVQEAAVRNAGVRPDAGPPPEPGALAAAVTRDLVGAPIIAVPTESPDGGVAWVSKEGDAPQSKAATEAKAAAKKVEEKKLADAKASADLAKETQARNDKLAAKKAEAKASAKGAGAQAGTGDGAQNGGMTQRGGGTFLGHAELTAPLSARALIDQGVDAILGGDLAGTVTMKQLDLTFLSGLSPRLRSTGGVLDGEVTLHGLLDRPVPTGALHLHNGSFDVVGQGIFDDVSLDATMTDKEIVLEHVSGSTGGGTFLATMTVKRSDATSSDEYDDYQFMGEVHAGDHDSVEGRFGADGKPLRASPVPIRQAGEVRGDLVAEVDFFGDYQGGNITSTIKIPSATMRVASLSGKKLPSLTPNPEVLVYNKGKEPHPAGIDTEELKRQKAAVAASNLRVDLHLELDRLQVSANDFDFPVTSRMHASWDSQHPDSPSADGTIEVSSGAFSALGRRFSIDNARITETGGDIADPELEIQARYENAQASVLVLISGSAKDPQIDLSSSPPMDQDAIAFFLATGRLQGQATTQGSGVDLGNAATSVVGALLFGKLRTNLADILPVDIIDIEAGGGDRPPEASVGKYVGERVYIGYRQRFSAAPTENESEATVEYEISRGLGATATVGEKNQGVMVVYTKDF
jgi:autotransporter translocation and assembly factor TamB